MNAVSQILDGEAIICGELLKIGEPSNTPTDADFDYTNADCDWKKIVENKIKFVAIKRKTFRLNIILSSLKLIWNFYFLT